MMVQVQEETDGAAWDAFVQAHPDATGNHRWIWREITRDVFRHRSAYLSARDETGIVGVLPLVIFRSVIWGRFLVSVPYLNKGGLLARDSDVERVLVAAAQTVAERERASFIEFRHRAQRPFLAATRSHKVSMELDLEPTEESQWSRFDTKLRNQIRKGMKSGLTVDVGRAEMADDFYAVFSQNMRDLGTPVYPRKLFEHVLERIESARAVIVRLGERPVGAGITIPFRDEVELPWASSIRAFNHVSVNNVLYWEVLRQAIGSAARRFDFGRSTPGDGPFNFKAQWGASPTPLYWQYSLAPGAAPPDFNPHSSKYAIAVGAWKRLPLSLACRLGPPIVRFIP